MIAIRFGYGERRKRRTATRERRRAAAALEFALILPAFLMMIFGILEFGRFVMVGQMVTAASRQGCRVAVLSNATTQDVVTEVTNYLAGGGIDATAVTVEITGQAIPNGPATQVIDLAEIKQGLSVRVLVECEYEGVAWLNSGFVDLPNITVATTMRKEAH
jgi:Flp pilus assembly protein TadG